MSVERTACRPRSSTSEIRAILPHGTQVRSGDTQAASDAEDTNSFISFLQTFLLSFAGVALFVGAFVIANSLAITIAQRTREFATLRTLGASRRQVLFSVILEALVMGVVASVVGLFLGLALGKGLFKLFDLVGFTLPNNGLTFETRTIVVSLLVGVLVTLLASLRPALRATRVPPIAAVREGATLPVGRFHRYRGIGARGHRLLGFAALLYGLFRSGLGTTQVLLWMGLGALLIFVGVALFSSHLVVPLARVLGWPATRIGGAAGSLARNNAERNPQRTASTASALMIGLALVALVATLAAGIVGTFNSAVDDLAPGDYAITAQNNFSPIPVSAANAATKTPGLERPRACAPATHSSSATTRLTAVDPTIGEGVQPRLEGGIAGRSLATLGATAPSSTTATRRATTCGRLAVRADLAHGQPLDAAVKGIFKPPAGGSPFGHVTISTATFDAQLRPPQNLFSFVTMRGGETEANKAALDRQPRGVPERQGADERRVHRQPDRRA